MSDFTDFHNQAIAEAITELGQPFAYKGTVYNGIISAVELTRDLAEGGQVETLATQILVSKAILATIPKSGETVLIGGTQKARIHRVASDEVSIELICMTATK